MSGGQTLGREQIAGLLPHAGAMMLLDEMLECEPHRIVCRCDSHRRPDHPMRTDAGLGSASAVEYAAQAMALHAALQASQQAQPPKLTPSAADASPSAADTSPSAADASPHGVLASVRALRLNVERLDDIAADLIVTATLHSGDAQSAMYEFCVTADARDLVSGRASVLFLAPQGQG